MCELSLAASSGVSLLAYPFDMYSVITALNFAAISSFPGFVSWRLSSSTRFSARVQLFGSCGWSSFHRRLTS